MVELMEKTLIPSYPDLPLELPEAANSLVYLDKGTAVLDLNGHVCHISGPSFVCVTRGDHAHVLYSYRVEAYTFSFESRLPEQLGSESEEAAARLFDNRDDLYHGVIPVPSESCYILRDTFKRMAVLLQDDPSIQKEAVDSFVSLLATADALRESFLSQANRHVSLRTKVLDYLQQHLFEPLTIDDVCKHFGFNRLYITNLFRKWTGQGIREYLVDERIQAAKRLLSSTSQPVDDIAKKCGFSTSSYFARQFHLREGCSPTQYRAHCHEGKPLSLYKTDNSSGM